MKEWKGSCDCCYKSGGPMFARIFFKKIMKEWQYLCPKCWEDKKKK